VSVTNGAIVAGSKVLAGLPGQFLALLVLNACFVAGLFWFLDKGEERRLTLLAPILKSCAEDIPTAAVEKMLRSQQHTPTSN
jgi:hypothetical protein